MNLQNKMTLTLLAILALWVVSMETKSLLELEDVTVAVDEPFKYQIGDKIFLSQYRIHRIVDKNTKTLPEWLTFDNATNVLYGTPGMGDIGTYQIRLKATCIDLLKMECQEKISRTFFIRIVEPIKSADSRGRLNYHLHAWNGKHHASPDEAPILQNSIDHLPIVFGKLFVYRIPANAFNDTEDGNTRNLTLSISLLYGKPIPLGAWLKFNSTSQTLYGIPLQQDFKDNADLFVERFVLIASDSQNQLARDVISLTYSFEVLDITHRISLTLDYGFENFHFERQNLVDVAELIAKFYGNANLKYLTFFDVTKGSVVVRWGNNSLFGTICYKDVIVNLFSRMGNESGSLTTEFAELLTMYNPVSIQLELSGPCLEPQLTPLPPFDSPVGASDSDKMWIEILLPALIVILVLVIIALVLLICCRHKKPSKEPKSDKPMFLEDRRPIIFPEELEMVDPSLKPKHPLILPRDYLTETPPAVPPHGLHELPSYHVPEINEDLFRPINSETPPPPSFNNQATTSEPPPYRLPPPYFNPHRSNIST